jgi:hypothetical protein
MTRLRQARPRTAIEAPGAFLENFLRAFFELFGHGVSLKHFAQFRAQIRQRTK